MSRRGSQDRTAPRGGALAAAHRGYAYQDLVAAYLLVRALVERFESVVVDRKIVDDDRFDDIEVATSGARIRRQLKSSTDPSAALSLSDFNSAGSSLRFDRLVNTMTAEGTRTADEYRLSATWQPPAPSDGLAGLLVASSDSGTFPGFATKTFRLDASTLWPEDGLPALAPLQHTSAGAKALSREEVVRFCERFVIEVSLPPASLDLSTPGPLEQLLLGLMSEQVGIGRYPNHDRDVVDAGALAIYVASTARTAGATLSPADIAQRLQLRMDFGRIAQAFPIDKAVLQERLSQRRHLCEAIRRGGVHLALAGPGSGKSWVLTQVAQDLRNEGFVVARHYCFLEPGDELVEQRVTTNVFFGNLLGELDDAFKSCSQTPPQRFAAGLPEEPHMTSRRCLTNSWSTPIPSQALQERAICTQYRTRSPRVFGGRCDWLAREKNGNAPSLQSRRHARARQLSSTGRTVDRYRPVRISQYCWSTHRRRSHLPWLSREWSRNSPMRKRVAQHSRMRPADARGPLGSVGAGVRGLAT